MSNQSIFEFEFQLGGTITPEMRRAFLQAQQSMGNLETKSAKTMKALKVGATIAVAAFAAVGAGIGKAVKAASEFQDSMAQVQSATGASMKEMKQMKEIAKNLYNENLGEDFNDLAEAIQTARQVTKLQGKDLEEATEKALLYRDVFGEDVSQSIKATDTMMKNFGITSAESYNLLAQGAQNGLNKSDELIDSANEYATYYSTLGFSADEMFDSFSNGLKNGAFNLDKVGDAVKEFGIRSKDGSKASMDAYKELGLNGEALTKTFASGGTGAKKAFKEVTNAIGNVKDPVKQSQIAVSLFGTQAEDLEMKVITSMGNVEKTFDGTKATMDEIKKTKFDTLGAGFKSIGRQLYTGFVIPLGDALLPALQTLSSYAKVAIPKISSYFKTSFATVKSVISNVSNFLKTDNGFSNYFQIVKTVFGGIKSTIAVFVPYIKMGLSGIFTFAKSIISQASAFWSTNGQQIMQAVRNVFGVISAVIKFVMPAVLLVIKSVWNNIKGVISGAIKIIMGVVKVFASLFTGDFRGMWQGVKQIFSGAVIGIWNLFQLMFYGKLLKGISIVAKSSIGFFRAMWASIKAFFVGGVKSVNDKVVTFAQAVGRGFKSAKHKAVEIVKDIWHSTKDYFSKIVDGAKALPGKMGQGIKNNAKKAISGITSMGNDLIVGIGKIVNGVIKGLNWVGGKVGIDAKISTWEVPKYAKGTNAHPGGLAILGDGGGSELYRTPDGRVGLSPAKDTLMNLAKGTQVIPHRETAKIMSSIPKYAFGKGVKNALGEGANWIADTYSSAKSTVGNVAGNVVDKVDDTLDYLTSPTKAFSKIIEKFGVSDQIPGVSGFMSEVGKGSYNFVKTGATNWLKDKIGLSSGMTGVAGGSIKNGFGVYDSLYNVARTIMNSALGRGLMITSGHRPGDQFDHGRHNAIDLSGFGSNGGYKAVAHWASRLPGVAYTIGDNTVFGRKYGDGSQPGWATGHMNHLHVSGGSIASNRRFEKGGNVNTNDSILVGENGPELLRNKKGSQILNTNKTQNLLENIKTFKNNNFKNPESKTIQISAPYNPVIEANGNNIDYDALERILKSDHQRFKEMMKKLMSQIAADDMNVAFDDSF